MMWQSVGGFGITASLLSLVSLGFWEICGKYSIMLTSSDFLVSDCNSVVEEYWGSLRSGKDLVTTTSPEVSVVEEKIK